MNPDVENISLNMLNIKCANEFRGIAYWLKHRDNGGTMKLLPEERNGFAKGFNRMIRSYSAITNTALVASNDE